MVLNQNITEETAHVPQVPPASVVGSQNDDARRETGEEAALLVQGVQKRIT